MPEGGNAVEIVLDLLLQRLDAGLELLLLLPVRFAELVHQLLHLLRVPDHPDLLEALGLALLLVLLGLGLLLLLGVLGHRVLVRRHVLGNLERRLDGIVVRLLVRLGLLLVRLGLLLGGRSSLGLLGSLLHGLLDILDLLVLGVRQLGVVLNGLLLLLELLLVKLHLGQRGLALAVEGGHHGLSSLLAEGLLHAREELLVLLLPALSSTRLKLLELRLPLVGRLLRLVSVKRMMPPVVIEAGAGAGARGQGHGVGAKLVRVRVGRVTGELRHQVLGQISLQKRGLLGLRSTADQEHERQAADTHRSHGAVLPPSRLAGGVGGLLSHRHRRSVILQHH
mmetsp:Transcript_53738/g.125618  ORF Transcript_53738/g.125618 Transcript_53738/m.125618 type:complete len:337 (-) Transcript_53738:6-1016(-)